ncbi:carbon-nitrogen hydrolase [Algimonas arctica]|uniref:Carbon-nitrogen hydrolase n=1 Tax=Algimonas arctica TaxID=1479486 RepID=A0A8J3CRB5_9PROT|nr:carbon-nitrogen hydrolase family protein [Algimonas arctica]GHA97953.1 carbon-nitrogen hydrolase [Algimonas arctica]
MGHLGVAAIQTAGRKSGNLDAIETDIAATAKRLPWVKMIVLGELAIHGASLQAAEDENGPTITRLQAIAKRHSIWLIPGSLYERRGTDIYNTTHVINPAGEIVARHDKLYPFLPYEKGVTPGRDFCVFDVPGVGRIGVAICYDMWFPEVIRTLTAMGAEAILLPTMTNTIDRDVELSIARANAATNQCYFIDVNVAGEQGNGQSVFYGPGGELLHACGVGAEVVALNLDFNEVRRVRELGWNGLGQVLKSFRDAPVEYDLYQSAENRRAAFKTLGPLTMPGRDTVGELDAAPTPPPTHKIID